MSTFQAFDLKDFLSEQPVVLTDNFGSLTDNFVALNELSVCLGELFVQRDDLFLELLESLLEERNLHGMFLLRIMVGLRFLDYLNINYRSKTYHRLNSQGLTRRVLLFSSEVAPLACVVGHSLRHG